MNGTVKRTLVGAVGAAVGGLAWFIAADVLHEELAWLAPFVGLTTGVAVRLVTEEPERGIRAGLTAAVICVLAIWITRYHVVRVTTATEQEIAHWLEAAYEGSFDEESMISLQADKIALEREAAGQPVEWPEDMSYEDAAWEEDYPTDIWAEAKERWERFSPDEQADRVAAHERDVKEIFDTRMSQVAADTLQNNLTILDFVWCLVAAAAAFRLPSGPLSDL